MGNEGSTSSTGESTPISENPSLYSMNSRARSSVESINSPSPIDAPEPDLSHLTPEEIIQIRSVMERARNLQQEESTTARKLDDEYLDLSTKFKIDSSETEFNDAGMSLCPDCGQDELVRDHDGPRSPMNVCMDCRKMICSRCSSYSRSLNVQKKQLVCMMCDKKRRLLTTTGMWYQGINDESEPPADRQIVGAATDWNREPDCPMDTSVTSSVSQASSRGSRESSEHTNGDSSWGGSRCGGDSGLSMDFSSLSIASSQNSELARQVYEQSRVKGPGATLPKSESDEFSDLTSDLDFDELASERSRLEGGSSADESGRDIQATIVSSQTEDRQDKHRPVFLSLSHPHIHSSLDGEDGTVDNIKKIISSIKPELDNKTKMLLLESPSGEHSSGSTPFTSSVALPKDDKLQPNRKYVSSLNSKEMIPQQEFLDSLSSNAQNLPECFQNSLLDSRSSDVSASKWNGAISSKTVTKSLTCPEVFSSSRKFSLDDLYIDMPTQHAEWLYNGLTASQTLQELSPMYRNEAEESFLNGIDDELDCDILNNRDKTSNISAAQFEDIGFHSTGTMTHSDSIMDLASLAVNITNSANSLTAMTQSPPVDISLGTSHSSLGWPLTPDSIENLDSSCSSPISPSDNDNTTPSAQSLNQSDLVQPSSKSIDYQDSKRQKVRQPSTDWSPVMDLSPILDVSPSVEEAEREDMLAKQMEEMEKQRSRDQLSEKDSDDDNDEDDDEQTKILEKDGFKLFDPTKLSNPHFIPRIPPPPSAKKLKKQLSEEHADDASIAVIDGPTTYIGTLKRSGNFEDISRISDDSYLIQHASELSPPGFHSRGIHTAEPANNAHLFSYKIEPRDLSDNASHNSTISLCQIPIKQLDDDRGTRRMKDFEALLTDEIHKIAEDMENIINRDTMDVKPIPPPKPRRKLPDPELIPPPLEWISASEGQHKSLCSTFSAEEPEENAASSQDYSLNEIPERKHFSRQDSVEKKHVSQQDSTERKPVSRQDSTERNKFSRQDSTERKKFSRQDSTERKHVKDMKAKPNPILVQHIESEEQVLSPFYKVMESPLTPDTTLIKREHSDYKPISSPPRDIYFYPSPVTPPDSDSSPPKPQSPSSPGTHIQEESSISARSSVDMTPPVRCLMNPYRSFSTTYDATEASVWSTTNDQAGANMISSLTQVSQTPTCSTSQFAVKPPISKRKSIKSLGDPKINYSPIYEQFKDVNTQNKSQQPDKNMPLLDQDLQYVSAMKEIFTSETSKKDIAQYTEIYIYPVVGEFPGRSRSSSAPSTELQLLSKIKQSSDPPLHRRSASADDENTTYERTASVRDKIREFEEITKQSPQNDTHREPRREAQVMKDKRTDSGGSTSSSGSSAQTSASRSSSDINRSQDKEDTRDGKKIRRKLPPIPVGETPVSAPKSASRRSRPPAVKRGEGVDHGDVDFEAENDTRRLDHTSVDIGYMTSFFIGPSNRTNIAVTRKINDLIQNDNLEPSRQIVTRGHSLSTKVKKHLTGGEKSKSLDSVESCSVGDETSETVRMRDQLQRTSSLGYGPKDETDEFIDSLIDIYGIPCTEAMKSLKKRVQDELRRVTRDRRRKLEDLEEIRTLQMQVGALQLESDTYARNRVLYGQRTHTLHLQEDSHHNNGKKGTQSPQSSSRSSSQVAPRRQRHKRQSSDPMISKFSPIKEDKDIETDFQIRMQEPLEIRVAKYLAAEDTNLSALSDSESSRSEPIRDARYNKIKPSDYTRVLYNQNRGLSDDRLLNSRYDQTGYEDTHYLSASRSDQQLACLSRASVFYSDDDESKTREEKKVMLQLEIMKRKQQLEETARLKNELLKLARARESLTDSYQDIPRQYGSSSSLSRSVPLGIIKPIDDIPPELYNLQIEKGQRSRETSQERSRERSRERRNENDIRSGRDASVDSIVIPERRSRDSNRYEPNHFQPSSHETTAVYNYSSTEYLAHKQESATRRHWDEPGRPWITGGHTNQSLDSSQTHSQIGASKRHDLFQSISSTRRESAKETPESFPV